ncbi:MAG TPA: AI-2E family transporter [Candidatus Saccharibacteria bacterium]|nr:AI-2E family transporter [Candidatus Saccharibacteria bacterium]HMT55359.1 AI-2E family transporter [Candidatus Saccharibacteria bacterium]
MFGRKNKEQVEITISNNTIIRFIAFVVATIFLLRLVDNIKHPLTLVFVSFFLSLALNPAVHWLSVRLKSKSRVRATAIAYSAVVSILIALFALVVPPLITQTTDFIKDVPTTLSSLKNKDNSLGRLIRRYELEEQVQNFASDWTRNLGDVKGPVIDAANRVFANIISIVTVLVLTFMMLIEGPRWVVAFWRHVPEHRRKHDQEIAAKMYKVVTSYVNGQVLVAGIGAVFAMIALVIASTIIGVSVNAVALGAIIFLFALIPSVGTILGALVVTIFSLFASPTLALVILAYFIIYQQIENATIQPMIQSRGNELTPMLVFIAAILGIGFGGVLGGFVAIPLAGCGKILFDDWLEDRSLSK